MRVDKNYFPGWVRKSITFSIDDGNLVYDKKFIDIVKPKGIIGTFNLCLPDLKNRTAEFYREFYEGFGIANHCAYHPFALTPDKIRPVAEEPFCESTADEGKLYKTTVENMYYVKVSSGWRKACTSEAYIEMIKQAQSELTEVFGEGSVSEFVWPFGEQADPTVMKYVSESFESVRKTGTLADSTNFAVPRDLAHWSYNARERELSELGKIYESYPDDGELKFFCFGIHSIDYERANAWGVLADFCEKYGGRSDTYYYATSRDIFRYRNAVESLIVTENTVENPTSIPLYVKIDGAPTVVAPGEKLSF